jgi:hypothetical protein
MGKELIERLAKQAGFSGGVITARDDYSEPEFLDHYAEELRAFAALVAEECAKTAESINHGGWDGTQFQAADAIRAKFKAE